MQERVPQWVYVVIGVLLVVVDRPSPSARDVASITRGTRVTVVGPEGD